MLFDSIFGYDSKEFVAFFPSARIKQNAFVRHEHGKLYDLGSKSVKYPTLAYTL